VGERSPVDGLYLLLLGALAVALLAVNAVQSGHSFGWDFRAFYDAGRDYLHLRTPYVSGSLADLTSQRNFVYPLPVAALFAPISIVPYSLAAALFVLTSAALLIAGLYLLGVRDVRCYVAMLVGAPTFSGLEIGTVSPLLVFLLALTWRYRDRALIVAPALVLLVLGKIFLWPVAVWLLATRRSKSVFAAVAVSAVAIVIASAPLGFGVLLHYPALLRTVSSLEGQSSLSLVALGTAVTSSASAGLALSLACGGLLLLGAVWVGRKGGDSGSFRLAIVAALALTPILWNHYLLLLFVPLALRRPRFSPIWLGTAWVLGALGGSTLAGGRLAVTVAAIWAVVLLQSGVVSGVDLSRSAAMHPPLVRLGGIILLWGGMIWAVVSLLGVVPAVAALRADPAAGEATGTASVRLLRAQNGICFRLVTDGLGLPAVVQVVQDRPRRVLVERRVERHDFEICARYRPDKGRGNLAKAFSARRVGLSLRARSVSGRQLISGPIVRIERSTTVSR
jgi:hypothetical protein